MNSVLVVEDEAVTRALITSTLADFGYQVLSSDSGKEGLWIALNKEPGLVLLDLMLPDLSGIQFCSQLRNDPRTRSVPVIMVTSRGEESDVVRGLEAGADDYVVKPVRPRELVARIRAVLRRGGNADTFQENDTIVHGTIQIDPTRHMLVVDGESVHTTATEFRVLHCLASHPGRVFTREQLLRSASRPEGEIIKRNVDVHVRALRRKLGSHASIIETVHGVGYRFREED